MRQIIFRPILAGVSILHMTKISVVIASSNARRSIVECLDAVRATCASHDAEVIVVDNSSDGTADCVAERGPQLTLVRAPELKLIPQLWEAGIRLARGEVIAITTAHFIPEPNWVERILESHREPYAGIGGAIENKADGGAVSWAIYFCRYSAYMLPLQQTRVEDFAADNASYKAAALHAYRVMRENGFWEAEIHARMRADGMELLLTPRVLVWHRKSFSFRAFAVQRFVHGRLYGAQRASRWSPAQRVLRIGASPLIPLVLLGRIASRLMKRRRHAASFLKALPALSAFLLSWTAGELMGYLARAPAQIPTGRSRAPR